MRAPLSIALKDLRQLSRDKANAFFTFVFPLLLALFFGFVFKGGGGGGGSAIDVALVNLDGGPASVAFAADLAADPALKVHTVATREEGETMVRKGAAGACIIIPDGFEERTGGLFTGSGLELTAVVDPRRTAEGGLLTGKLNEIAFRQLSRGFADPELMDKNLANARRDIERNPSLSAGQKFLFGAFFSSAGALSRGLAAQGDGGAPADPADAGAGAGGWRPVNVQMELLKSQQMGRTPTSFEISFPQSLAWGLMGCVMAFGASLASERVRGTLTRLQLAPLGRGHILIGKAGACFIACLVVQAFLLLFAILAFSARVNSPWLTLTACLANAVGFTGIMMTLAGLSRTEGAAQGYGRAVVLVLAMIGGGSIPLFFMPPIMKTVSLFSPFRWAIDGVEMGMWRGEAAADVLLPVAIMLATGVVGFIIGVRAMRWSEV